MRVLLKDEEAHLYYGPNDTWVTDPQVATDFRILERAGLEARHHSAQSLAVVLRYEMPECELALNPIYCVGPESHRPQAVLPG
jgi:hypothetical protein